MQTGKNPFTTPEMKQYYTSLPLFVQESIQQSGVKFDTVEQLQAFVDQLNHRK
jgi:peroxiredoxin